jgi:hypothetical protein
MIPLSVSRAMTTKTRVKKTKLGYAAQEKVLFFWVTLQNGFVSEGDAQSWLNVRFNKV